MEFKGISFLFIFLVLGGCLGFKKVLIREGVVFERVERVEFYGNQHIINIT